MKRLISIVLSATVCVASIVAQNFYNQSDVQWICVPDHADWTYEVGQPATIDVQLLWHGMPQDGVSVTYTIGGDCLEADTRGVVVTHDGHASIDAGTSQRPAFRDCQMQAVVDGKTYKNHLKIGFSPDRLEPFTQMPNDFDTFWQSVLERQKQIKPSVVVTPEPRYSTERVDCYKVKLRCYRPDGQHYIYGYLTKPKDASADHRYPVLVSPPGAGVKPMDPMKTIFYAEQGIIRFDIEIHGIDPSVDADTYKDITHAFGDHHSTGYLASGLQSRDTYYMQKVYASLVRAVDFVVSLPEWDGRNVLVQGGSQGGALSIVLAALDPRVTAIAIAHPALTDMAAYSQAGRTGGYPHFGRKYRDVVLTPQIIETLAYYDVINFARLVKCPVYLTYGYNDNVCPPTTSAEVYNVLTCEKERYVTPINEHWISLATRQAQLDYLKRHLK